MGRKRKVGRPTGSGKKRKRVVKKKGRRRLPPRVKTGKNKGQFKKRKGSKAKKKSRRRVGRPRKR